MSRIFVVHSSTYNQFSWKKKEGKKGEKEKKKKRKKPVLTVIRPIMHDPPQVINARAPYRLRSPEVVQHGVDVQFRRQVVGGNIFDNAGEVLGDDFARELGESLADFLHGGTLGGPDVDDEDAIVGLWLFGCGGGEGGEFGVEGVDAGGGDGGPFAVKWEV